MPAKEVARDRVLNDQELAQVILAARKIGGSYGGIVELLALTGQRREEVARLQWEELDLAQRVWRLPRSRTKAVIKPQPEEVSRKWAYQPASEMIEDQGSSIKLL